ncbi:MAG: glycosyltransferase [Christensenellales bacterium]
MAGQQRVYDYTWDDDFSAARNAFLAYATRPFILWLDADDVMERSEREKLMALKARLTADVDAVMMKYHAGIGRDGRPSLIYERERIVRRDAGFVFSGVVHEAMSVSGNVLHEDIVIRHERGDKPPQGRRNLDIYEKWLARGRRMNARDCYYYAREWMDWGDAGMAERAFARFLAMPDGWIENRVDAYIQRAECLQRLGRRAEARQSLLASLAGRAEGGGLCALGDLEMEESAWQAAAFWYRAAMLCKPTSRFVQPDFMITCPRCSCASMTAWANTGWLRR